jgi:hypothetical protein
MRPAIRFTLLLSAVTISALAAAMWLRVEGIRAQRRSPVPGAQQPEMPQQFQGTPGSPSATRTIKGDELPPPPKPFGGQDRA